MSGAVANLVEDLVALDDAGLDDHIRSLELDARALQARYSAAIAVAEARSLHRRDGHHTMKGYLRATVNWSNAEVARQRKLARAIDRCPDIGEALLAGWIGVPQALELAKALANRRVTDVITAVIPALLERAEHRDFDDFKVDLDRFVMLADVDGSWEHVESMVAGRSARVSPVGDTIDVAASGGDALTAEKWVTIFDEFVQAEFRKDGDERRRRFGDDALLHPLPRTAAQRRFDALDAIFDAAHLAMAGGKRPDPVVNIAVDHRTAHDAFASADILLPNGDQIEIDRLDPDVATEALDAFAADPKTLLDRHCETSSGIPVHPFLVVQAALTGLVRRVVVDSEGVTIEQGRLRRLFEGNARVAALVLRRSCGHNGCDVRACRCDVDHMTSWEDGGRTDQRNADPRCGVHDRWKHRHRWRSRRDATGRVFNIRPDDTIVLPVGERPPDLTELELREIARRRVEALAHGR